MEQVSLRNRIWNSVVNQFDGRQTSSRIIFDTLFGIVLPIICFYVDSVITFGSIIPQSLRTSIYFAVLLSIVALIIKFITKGQYDWLNMIFLGPTLLLGALLSLTMGFSLLPMSVLALVVGIGLLGFVPFATMLVYWRNFVALFRKMKVDFAIPMLVILILCGAEVVAISSLGVYIDYKVKYYEDCLLSKDEREYKIGLDGLKRYRLFKWGDFRDIVWKYIGCNDDVVRKRLKTTYEELTGRDIENSVEYKRAKD